MKYLCIAANLLLAFLVLSAPGTAAAQGADPLSVVNAFNAASIARDVDAELALFADDATASFPGQPEPNFFKGKEEIRKWLETDTGNNIHLEVSNLKVVGNKVTWNAVVSDDELRKLGVALEGSAEATVENGKIKAFTFAISAESVAKLNAAIAQLPTTGGEPQPSPAWLIALVGIAVMLAGLVALRRSTRAS